MKLQYKASYLDKAVFDCITDLRKRGEFKYKVIGLLESLSTFDVVTNINFIRLILIDLIQ